MAQILTMRKGNSPEFWFSLVSRAKGSGTGRPDPFLSGPWQGERDCHEIEQGGSEQLSLSLCDSAGGRDYLEFGQEWRNEARRRSGTVKWVGTDGRQFFSLAEVGGGWMETGSKGRRFGRGGGRSEEEE